MKGPRSTLLFHRSPNPPDMRNPRPILLVEDSKKDIELALDALAEFNFANEIVVVRDGAAALDFLHRRGPFAGTAGELPAIVLLDLKMPKVDGLEVLREMKSEPRLRRVPVVMMTSSREQSDLIRSYDLGVNSYVVKPVRFDEFVAAVKQLGVYWALLNEPSPSGTVSAPASEPNPE